MSNSSGKTGKTMELASYIYAAWAYEVAHQDSNTVDFDASLAMSKDLEPLDLQLSKLAQTWRTRMLAPLAIANTILLSTAIPAIAANAPEAAVNMAPWCSSLYLCDTGYVLEVQKLLVSRGYSITIDGVYGRETKQAVIDFQKTQTNLNADGIPGAQTIALLRSAVSSSPSPNAPINPSIRPNPQSPPPITVRPNDPAKAAMGSEVGNLQILLKRRGFYEGEVDGVIGRSTTIAVAKAQQAYGLAADGFAGPLTMQALLAGGTNVALAQPAFSQLPQPETIKDIQKSLKERGFYDGVVDGIYGLRTKNSILKAQLAYGQVATGEFTPALLNALQSQGWRSPTATSSPPPTSTPAQPPQTNNPANPPPIPPPQANASTNVPSVNPTANKSSINPNINVNFNISPRLTPNITLPSMDGSNANGLAPVSGQNAPISPI
ncbi:peptidoglycan-binding protein [Pseudanabaena sp. FACHB-1277]|uniref:Peptidoglycan-binding protein n=2 Tax=Pseudanabaena TaxID=1152 RepID=A0A926Z9X0_9CYAN|nr:peptidoglycan-binding protein [Pseudanabaena cinerea FACHB-1277]